MKITYKEHIINAERDKNLIGESAVYFYIVRKSDGFMIESSLDYGHNVREVIKFLKERVNNEIASING